MMVNMKREREIVLVHILCGGQAEPVYRSIEYSMCLHGSAWRENGEWRRS